MLEEEVEAVLENEKAAATAANIPFAAAPAAASDDDDDVVPPPPPPAHPAPHAAPSASSPFAVPHLLLRHATRRRCSLDGGAGRRGMSMSSPRSPSTTMTPTDFAPDSSAAAKRRKIGNSGRGLSSRLSSLVSA